MAQRPKLKGTELLYRSCKKGSPRNNRVKRNPSPLRRVSGRQLKVKAPVRARFDRFEPANPVPRRTAVKANEIQIHSWNVPRRRFELLARARTRDSTSRIWEN